MSESTPLLNNERSSINAVRITKDVYVYEPSGGSSNRVEISADSPRIILIFGWLDGPVKHLTKYMAGYATLYPHAIQVLSLSKQSIYRSRREKKLDTVRPILKLLQEHNYLTSSPPNILVHVFSDGGSVQFNLLSELLRETPNPSLDTMTLPATAIVFDSLPGSPDLRPGLRAHTEGIRSPILKYLAYIPLTLLWSFVMGLSWLRGEHDPITSMRLGLNKPDVLPWTHAKTPRVYIYSKEDRIVNYKFVEEHIARGTAAGLAISTEVFKGSAHVSHMRVDPARYWEVVEKLWKEGLDVQRSLA